MNSFKMKIYRMYFLLCATIVVAHYKKCYDEFSTCLITNTDSPRVGSKFTLTQLTAEDWCRNHSSLLAIITSETVQYSMSKFVRDPSAYLSGEIITNGYRIWDWTGERQSGIINLHSSFDSRNYLYAYLFAAANRTFVSFDSHATANRKFICSYYPDGSERCSSGYLQFGKRCYKASNNKVTWFIARSKCFQEGSDLAIFENDIRSITSAWIRRGVDQYWIGLRKGSWHWFSDQKPVELTYSNWDDDNPLSTGGDCICLKARTAEWKNCDCLQNNRYICIQDYASGSTSTVTTTSSKMTTTTTRMTATTTRMNTKSTKPQTTQSTTMAIPTVIVGESSSQFHSTAINVLDDNYYRSNISEDPPITLGSGQTSGYLPIIGIGIVCLLILIVVIAVVVFIKNRRSRSGDRKPSNGNPPPPMSPYKDDAPNTVYAAVIPNTNDPVYSASEINSNQTVYAELDLDPKRNYISPTQRTSNPGRFTSEQTPSQAVYAEVNQVPNEDMNGRPEDSSEYDNIQMVMDSVYANSAQTRV